VFLKYIAKRCRKMLIGGLTPISPSFPTRYDQLINRKLKEKAKKISWMNKKSEWLWKGLKEQRRGL
jgi:hypothetical protein